MSQASQLETKHGETVADTRFSVPSSVLPDLTLAENVVICRQWIKPAPAKEGKNTKGGDPSYLGRYVCLFPTSYIRS